MGLITSVDNPCKIRNSRKDRTLRSKYLGEFPLVYLEKLRTWNSLKHKLALLPLPREPVSKWCAKVVIIFRCSIHSMSGHMALP